MTTQTLVQMADQVAAFFASYPEAATEGTANHLKSFQDPRMRREIEAHLKDKAGAGRSRIAIEAMQRVAATGAAKKSA